MEKKDWHGIMKILELKHIDAQGQIISEQNNLRNLLHQGGEEFLLQAAFSGGRVSNVIPDFYYLGLDNRATVAATDTMDNLIGEPNGGGYVRQQIASNGDFVVSFDTDHYIATSPIVAFRATTNGWGPVVNLFLTNTADNSGTLISTVTLQSAISLNIGDAVTMRIGLLLRECGTTTGSSGSGSTTTPFLKSIKRKL